MVEKKQKELLLSVKEKDEIVDLLKTKGVPQQCPMCANKNWAIGDGFVNQYIQGDYRGVRLGGASIPSIPIICTNCGFMSHHALGVLGLIKKQELEEDKK